MSNIEEFAAPLYHCEMNKNQFFQTIGVLVIVALASYWFMESPSMKLKAVPPLEATPVAQTETPTQATPTSTVPAAVPVVIPVKDTSPNPAMAKIKGLDITTLVEGSGPQVVSGQTISVDYTGMFTDGKVFDSSIPRGQPLSVALGKSQVIKGWDLGIVGMKVGEKRRLTIAPELAYGEAGFPGAIPPNSTLIFEITLLSFK